MAQFFLLHIVTDHIGDGRCLPAQPWMHSCDGIQECSQLTLLLCKLQYNTSPVKCTGCGLTTAPCLRTVAHAKRASIRPDNEC